jgi:hypothetical protein
MPEGMEKTMKRDKRLMQTTGLTRKINTLVILSLLLIMTCMVTTAQTTGGTITGTVLDSSRAGLNGARVVVVDTATNAKQTLMTAGAGLFNVPNVNPGNYTVTVTAEGFSPQEVHALVEVSKDTVLTIQMQVGNVDSTVVVTASVAPIVDLDSSSLNQVVDGKTTRELPLNGRDFTMLAVLEPNVHTVDDQNSISAGDNSRANRGVGTQISIGGTRPQQNVYRLDGIITNDYSGAGPGGALGGTLGVDAIQEFSVVTSNATADFGRTSGGTISAVTRAGGNDFHGSAYEFIRNSFFDAHNYFSTGATSPLHRNQFGGTVGGPIKKDKMFFFFNYEGIRQSQTLTVANTVPSPNARLGWLQCTQPATGTQSTGCLTGIGGTKAPAGTTGLQQTAINALVAPYLQFFPVPNGTITGDTGTWNFPSPAVVSENLYTGRVDYTISKNDTIHATALQDGSLASQPDNFDNVLEGLQPLRRLFTVSEAHIFSPNIVNFARVGYNYNHVVAPASNTALNALAGNTQYGFVPGETVGEMHIGGLSAFFGGAGVEGVYTYNYNSYQAGDDVYITKGKHSAQAGFNFEQIQSNDQGSSTYGYYVFGSYASFLTNAPTSFTSSVPGSTTPAYLRQKIYGAYIQDAYHLRRNLTVNVGVRYEPTSTITEKYGHLSVLPTDTAATPKLGGSLFNNPSLLNFAPRVGVAWDPFSNGKTSVRGSYGIYDTLPMPYMFILSTLNVAPYNETISVTTATNIGTAANPQYIGGTFPTATYSDALASAAPANKYAYVDQNPRRPYVQQYMFNMQQELLAGTTLEIGYTGAHGVRQPTKSNDGNIVEPTNATAANWGNPANYGLMTWPLATLTTTTTAAGVTKTTEAFSGTKINPNAAIGQTDTTYFNQSTTYNAFNASLRRNIGATRIGVTYTWAKAMDESSSSNGGTNFTNSSTVAPFPREISRFKGLSDFDVKSNLSVNAIYTVPGPKHGGIAQLLASGYQIGGIGRSATGLPFTALVTGDAVGLQSASTFSYPDRIYTGTGCSGNPVNKGNVINYLNTACFAFPQGIPNTSTTTTAKNGTVTTVTTYYPQFGNEQRNSIIGPGINDIDLLFVKNTPLSRIHEGFRAEFRGEAFNVLNHPMFQAPSRTSSAIFNNLGVASTPQTLTATSVDERELQFGMKLIF